MMDMQIYMPLDFYLITLFCIFSLGIMLGLAICAYADRKKKED